MNVKVGTEKVELDGENDQIVSTTPNGQNVKFGTSRVESDSTKIIHEDENELVIPAWIAREGVLQYANGKAFRPADELKNSFFTFENAWVVSKKHPEHMILTKPYEITGKIAETQLDETRNLVKGNVHLFKAKNDAGFLDDVRAGKLKDVSIGFLYEEDWQAGKWNGKPYDFVQRNILINHVAVGLPKGRMTSPSVGLGLDSSGAVHVGLDPWEETESMIRSGHGDASKASTCRTKVLSETQGISLVVCKNKDTGDWYDQSFLFDKSKGWSMSKAKDWFQGHAANDASKWFIKVMVDSMTQEIDSFGDASFPDECFAYVPESAKGKDGNKSERKLPYKNADGSVDWPHVRNALARLDQTIGIPAAEKEQIRKKLEALIASSQNPANAGDSAGGGSGGASQTNQPAKPKEPEKPAPTTQKPAPTTQELIDRNKTVRELASKVL